MQNLPQPTSFPTDASLQELLQIASNKYEIRFETVKIGDCRLEILQLADMEEYVDCLAENLHYGEKLELPFWAKIWPSSILLSYFLQRLTQDQPGPVLELGAGIGICGLLAAWQGREVIISDLHEDALLFSQINILQNNLSARACIAKVDFTRDKLPMHFRYILGSEILYKESSYNPLLKFLLQHLQPAYGAEAILAKSYKLKADKFFNLAREYFYLQEKNLGYRQQTNQNQAAAPEKYLTQIHRLHPKKHV